MNHENKGLVTILSLSLSLAMFHSISQQLLLHAASMRTRELASHEIKKQNIPAAHQYHVQANPWYTELELNQYETHASLYHAQPGCHITLLVVVLLLLPSMKFVRQTNKQKGPGRCFTEIQPCHASYE